MKVHVVCRTDQLDWILGKIARQLVKELSHLVQVSLGSEPDGSAQINHYVWYDDFHGASSTATIGITHIDSIRKLELIQEQLKLAAAGICLSSNLMENLIHAGLPRDRLCYVNPSHDGIIAAKKIRIGITTRLYPPDPCKREWMLDELTSHIAPVDFSFSIMGSGWDTIVQTLRSRGFEVTYHPNFDLEHYRSIVPTFDYYLYLGWDDGSMGFLDALHAGVKTIATRQGFHLDIEGGLTHPIDDLDSLVAVFLGIAQKKNARSNSVRDLTWPHYARKHLEIWEYLLSGHQNARSTYRDGLNSLLDPEPRNDLARGQAFRAELEKIDQKRAELQFTETRKQQDGSTKLRTENDAPPIL
jgi:hypothetical protein